MIYGVGTDIVHLPKLVKLGEAALSRMLHPGELTDGRAEHLAGVVAAKEALFKALGTTPKWLEVTLTYNEHGKPLFKLPAGLLPTGATALVSISHDGEYAVACVIITGDGTI